MSSLLLAGAAALGLCPDCDLQQVNITVTETGGASARAEVEAQPDPTTWSDVIVVSGDRVDRGDVVRVGDVPPINPDAAGIVARLPGAALIDNGGLSGQVQYRGLFGPRVAIRIDGQAFASGGPNLMDPPLHYAPAPLLRSLQVTRGPAPVSDGLALSASVNAVFKRIDYAASSQGVVSGDLTAIARTVDDSQAFGGIVGYATDRQRIQLLGSIESGGDTRTPVATLTGMDHNRLAYGVGYGLRLTESTEITLDYRRQEVDDTGNPPFPMDIRFMDTSTSRLGLNTALARWDLAFMLSHARVDHAMNNFSQRPGPQPAMMRWRETFASSETVMAEVSGARDLAGGTLSIGADTKRTRHDVTITNPANGNFFVTPFPDIEMGRTGAFAEWDGPAGGFDLYIGARVDAHEAEAGEPSVGPALPMGPNMLANAFTAADRSWDDVTVDGLIRLSRPVNDALTLRAALSRKSRVTGYLERFGWLPISASGGLADGNTYVGTLDLDPEIATALEVGFDFANDRVYLRPTAYVSRIDDYVQGVPADPDTPGVIDTPLEMISSMNGDPTPLRFANTEAQLIGFDADFGARLAPDWRVDGVLTYVRGERKDVDEDLYRITPPSLRLGLTYDQAAWSATLETLAVAEQDRVSGVNNETPTPGYVLLNAFAAWTVTEAVSVSAGLENILDHRYREHLSGFNRNSGLGIGAGERLPGVGAGAWVRVNTRF
jgi:iron complex outermembrane receptor protein